MDVNGLYDIMAKPVTVQKSYVENNKKDTAAKTNQKTQEDTNEAAVYEKSEVTKDGIKKTDIDKLLKETEAQAESLRKMVLQLLEKQKDKANKAYALTGPFKGDLLIDIDEETRAAAKKAISEDGYYGVKQTSQRILGFAEAMAGGDLNKLTALKDAALKGFKEAEKIWGGKLPEICYQTYDAVVKGFEELETKYAGASTVDTQA